MSKDEIYEKKKSERTSEHKNSKWRKAQTAQVVKLGREYRVLVLIFGVLTVFCFVVSFSVWFLFQMDLKDKGVIVTGGAAGIGRSIVEEFMKHGARVAICDINEENGEQMCKQLGLKYGKEKVIFCECDVTDYSQFEEAFHNTIEAFGTLDVVVNNAGVMNDRLWELEVDVNLNGVIRGTLLGLQFMGKNRGGQGGILVNIGSNCSLKPYTSAPIYSATKHAIIGLTRAFGDYYHLNTTGVKVFALCPSATDTGLISDIRKQLLSTDFEKAWKQDTVHVIPQKSEYVARCLIQILPTASSGSVWFVENSLPPKQIDYSKT